MKKIILYLVVFFLNVSFIYKEDQCKEVLNNPAYLKGKKINGKINGKKILVLEVKNVENEYDRFLLININNGFKCNHHSLLNTNDYQGYSTNYLKLQKDGFSYSIEYGSRYYYNYEFYFEFRKDNFYLKKIEMKSFDRANPKITKSKTRLISSKVSFEKFNIENYLVD
ncbi:hypothetical protein [Flavobacterium sp. KJJ]|uniref:hypothetical protein n=1 Tax=Flavobacterium sp. KJJ TaxID=1270193 RepID=UPI000AC540D6|nr:hypothetical protein [Flavobacterium sp. KJJ]